MIKIRTFVFTDHEIRGDCGSDCGRNVSKIHDRFGTKRVDHSSADKLASKTEKRWNK